MPVRNATPLDSPAIASLGDDVVKGVDREFITWESLTDNIGLYLQAPSVRGFVDVRDGEYNAALIGTIARVPWTHRDPIAYVMMWWSRNAHAGLRVFHTFQRWAREHGATLLLSAARDNRTERLYQRMGMRQLESNYLGRL